VLDFFCSGGKQTSGSDAFSAGEENRLPGMLFLLPERKTDFRSAAFSVRERNPRSGWLHSYQNQV